MRTLDVDQDFMKTIRVGLWLLLMLKNVRLCCGNGACDLRIPARASPNIGSFILVHYNDLFRKFGIRCCCCVVVIVPLDTNDGSGWMRGGWLQVDFRDTLGGQMGRLGQFHATQLRYDGRFATGSVPQYTNDGSGWKMIEAAAADADACEYWFWCW